MSFEVIHGDCLDVMAGMEAGSVDAVVTDPPYGLEFMGKEWDRLRPDIITRRGGRTPGRAERDNDKFSPVVYGTATQRSTLVCSGCGKRDKFATPHGCDAGWERLYLYDKNVAAAYGMAMQDWHRSWLTESLRVLKPSHYILAFGGTRTWHRLACAIEDAGFEIRDTLMWLYGSGFPKGRACLKPSWEPIILARKPGPMRELSIDDCRITGVIDPVRGGYATPGNGCAGYGGGWVGGYRGAEEPHPQSVRHHASGRWPANLAVDEEAAGMLDEAAGTCSYNPAGDFAHNQPGGWAGGDRSVFGYGDSGGPSRFFYCAKASRAERSAGCEGMDAQQVDTSREPDSPGANGPHNRGGRSAKNHHPTVKPIALMRWLVRLVSRPGDVILDPFTGSGTTGVACVEEGRDFVGIERESDYVEIARRRIEAAAAQQRLPV